VLDVPHQERAIELDAARGEDRTIVKEARSNVPDLERLQVPVLDAESYQRW
jgi:hypothetical protein